jgi:hypothetical protein
VPPLQLKLGADTKRTPNQPANPSLAASSGVIEMKRLVEIRSYNLKPGSRIEFHRLVCEKSLPLLKRWGVDVVTFGPSPHDDNSYYLIRTYKDLDDRKSSQDAFYGSPDWRQGPREAIVSLIDSDTSIVIEMEASVVDSLRAQL